MSDTAGFEDSTGLQPRRWRELLLGDLTSGIKFKETASYTKQLLRTTSFRERRCVCDGILLYARAARRWAFYRLLCTRGLEKRCARWAASFLELSAVDKQHLRTILYCNQVTD